MASNEPEYQQNIFTTEEEEEEEEIDDEESEDEDDDEASPSSSSTSEDNNTNKDSSAVAGENPATTASVGATAIVPSSTAAALNGSVIETLPLVVAELSPDHNRQRIAEVLPVVIEEKKPSALDDSRRLFQRLWTDEDEIGLLQGFLEYTIQRGTKNSSHHYDTGPFYDQIKDRLQLEFNKNQLVEKLRRLKKKYRNVVSRISSGKDFSFKSAHDQMTFEISRKIWSGISGGGGSGGVEEAGLEDEDVKPLNIININSEMNNGNNNTIGLDANNSEKKLPRSRKRSRKRPAAEVNDLERDQATSSIPNVIEDTVRSCISPLFKELLQSAINGPGNPGGYGGITLNPLPLNFGINSLNSLTGEIADEKWRKQHILELEVYSKRLELVQDQIKSALEELRSMSSG